MLWVVHVGLVAAWLMMNGMSGLSTDALTVGKNIYAPDPPPYPVQRYELSFDNSTNPKQTYLDLIRGIRRILTDNQSNPVFEIPRLVDRDSVPSTRRFILVELVNSNEDTITVAIDTTRLYVVGYRRTNEFHYFPDTAEGVETLFPDLPHTELPFNSSYGALEREGGGRSTTLLGIASLEQAIIDLQDYNRPRLARAFTVIIQMIPEAIRFRYIENFVGTLIERQVVQVPYQTMLDLENSWGELSNRIQNSVDRTLDPPVLLTNRLGNPVLVSTVTTGLAINIGILFFVCNRSPNANQLSLISTGGGTYCANISEPIIGIPTEKGSAHLEAAGDTCKIGEPIIGLPTKKGSAHLEAVGDTCKIGEPIIRLPTEKGSVHLEAAGDTCKIGEPIISLPTEKGSAYLEAAGDTCKIGEPIIRLPTKKGSAHLEAAGDNCKIGEPIIGIPTEKGSAHLEAAGDTCKIGEPIIRLPTEKGSSHLEAAGDNCKIGEPIIGKPIIGLPTEKGSAHLEAVGDTCKIGEPIIGLPTEKGSAHLEAAGDTCKIGEPIIRLPTEKGSAHLEATGDICKIGEPTIRIIGRNGLCADVRDGFYDDGNPIQLWPCKSNEDLNQLWTLKADGTIRSNGKCLTTYGYAPRKYIMIYDCSCVAPDATKWDIWDNGTIINPKTSLVLSATSGNSMTILTVEKNLYASSQAWVVANNTQPTVTPIMNSKGDMCLEAPDYNPQIIYRGCQSGEIRQSFAVYPDGSIRPDKTRDDCLTADTKKSVVVTAGCNGGAEQRWSFNRDYTISNLVTGLAIDARNDVISLNPRELQESQEWHAWLL